MKKSKINSYLKSPYLVACVFCSFAGLYLVISSDPIGWLPILAGLTMFANFLEN